MIIMIISIITISITITISIMLYILSFNVALSYGLTKFIKFNYWI